MVKNLLNALFYSMVFFAGLHLVILAFMAISQKNPTYLNIFSILGVQDFLPASLVSTLLGEIASFFVMGVVFVFFYIIKRKRI